MTPRVVIIGGGFGGLEAAFLLKALLKPASEIELVDKSRHHAFIPSIHLVVSDRVSEDAIRIPLNVVLAAGGVRFVQDEVLAIDTDNMVVKGKGSSLPYDYLLIAAGATNHFFDIPGAEEYSLRFRTPEDAARIRSRVLACLSGRPCHIVLAGAGTEGVEVIGEVLDLISGEGLEEELQRGDISITLIEGKSSLLPSFPAEAGNIAEKYLRDRGVTLISGDRIAEVKNDKVVLQSGKVLPASALIWSGGIRPSRIIRELPFEKDPWGWLKVNDLLEVSGRERLYAIGDCVSISTEDGPYALQRLAYHAQDQARVAALNIAAAIGGGSRVVYTPKNRPQLISIGKNMGIMAAGDRILSGPWVVALKKGIERRHLASCLARPVASTVWSRLPGAGILQRLRVKLPV